LVLRPAEEVEEPADGRPVAVLADPSGAVFTVSKVV
jgi:hypothetical protein